MIASQSSSSVNATLHYDVIAHVTIVYNVTSLEPPYWSLLWRISFSMTLVVIMIAAVVGNLLVIVVIVRNRGMRTRTNLFLCNLAVIDFLCAIVDMPFSLVTMATGRWLFDDNVCKLNGFAMPFLFVASIHTMMYNAIYKYVSITDPFGIGNAGRRPNLISSSRGVRAMIVAAWAWAILAGSLTVSPLTTVLYKPGTSQCGPAYPRQPSQYVHFAFFVSTCNVIPLLVVAVCYARLFDVIRRHSSRLRRTTTEPKAIVCVQQRRVATTLLFIVATFAVSWTPWTIYALCSIFIENIGPYANPIAYWFGYLSSACNPIIYALRSDAFRHGYKQVLAAAGFKVPQRVASINRTPRVLYQQHQRLQQQGFQGNDYSYDSYMKYNGDRNELPMYVLSSLRDSVPPTHSCHVANAITAGHEIAHAGEYLMTPRCFADQQAPERRFHTSAYDDSEICSPCPLENVLSISGRTQNVVDVVGVCKTSTSDLVRTDAKVSGVGLERHVSKSVSSLSSVGLRDCVQCVVRPDINSSLNQLSSRTHEDAGSSPHPRSASVTLPRMWVDSSSPMNVGSHQVTPRWPYRIKSQSEANFLSTNMYDNQQAIVYSPAGVGAERSAGGVARRLYSRLFPATTTITTNNQRVFHRRCKGASTELRATLADVETSEMGNKFTDYSRRHQQLPASSQNGSQCLRNEDNHQRLESDVNNDEDGRQKRPHSTWHFWSLKYGSRVSRNYEANNSVGHVLEERSVANIQMAKRRPATLDRRLSWRGHIQNCSNHMETAFDNSINQSVYSKRVGTLPSMRRIDKSRSTLASVVRFPSIERLDSDQW